MKLRSALLLTLPLVAVVAAFTSRPPPVQGPPAHHVNVHVTCDSSKATVLTIAPWKVPGAKNDTLTWQLTGGATNVQVQPTGQWPLTRVPNSTQRRILFAISDTASAGTYPYRLTLTCPGMTIVIDPDVIVQ